MTREYNKIRKGMMKSSSVNKRRLISFVISICMVITMIPQAAFAETETAVTVTTKEEFLKQISDNETCDVIVLGNNIQLDRPTEGDNAIMIERPITIRGGGYTLDIGYGGIILGGDTTLENVSIEFINPVRNAIIANGYDLTLNGVNGSGTYPVNIFCGSITDYNGTDTVPDTSATVGGSTLTIKGNGNKLSDIYAGSLSDGATEEEAESNVYTRDVNIVIDNYSVGTVGAIYSCGAREPRGEGAGSIFYNDSSKYIMNGDVYVKLDCNVVKNVYGETGGSGDTFVEYVDTQEKGYSKTIMLADVSGINVKNGNFVVAKESSFSVDANISIAEGSILDFSGFQSMIPVNDFTGGGTLILPEKQTMVINGGISGKTSVGIGSIFNEVSYTAAVEEHLYISIPKTAVNSDAFTFLPYQNSSIKMPEYVAGKKGWIVTTETDGGDENTEKVTKINQVSAKDICEIESNDMVYIPITINYDSLADENNPGLRFIPVVISLDGVIVEATHDEDGYQYSCEAIQSMFFDVGDADDEEWLLIYGDGSTLPDGQYQFTITIPAEYMSNEEDKILTTTVNVGTVGGGQEPEIPENEDIIITVPAAVANLTYTGDEQIGVDEGEGYTLEDHQATNVGDYTATATLNEGYKWSDGTTEQKTISWSIAQARLDGSDASTVVSLENSEYTYTGSEIRPTVTSVVLGDKKLDPSIDYDVAYSNNTAVGTEAKVIITGKGNYTGEITKKFTIKEAESGGDPVDPGPAPNPDPTPDPQPCSHSYTKQDVKQGALKSPATCTTAAVYYKSCDKCGEVSPSASDTFTSGSPAGHKHGAYVTTKKAGFGVAGTQAATCSVCKVHKLTRTIPAVSAPALSKTAFTYNKKTQKPSVAVKDVAGKAVSAAVVNKGGKNVGKYAVTVTLTGANHSGTQTVYFNVNPKGVKVSKLSKGKKSMTVKWKKPSSTYRKQTSGYQIRYSTSSKMTKAKTVTVKGTKATSKKIKKMKAKKKYYVQIRTYKTVKGVKYYSGWSAKKSVKTR